MTLRPPTSTLFPYTTLFRSRGVLRAPLQVWPPGAARALASVEDVRDRKSTRLNSSHVAISYAVFCLKKKTRIAFMCYCSKHTRKDLKHSTECERMEDGILVA